MRHPATSSNVLRVAAVALAASLAGCAATGDVASGPQFAVEIERHHVRLGEQGFSPLRNLPVGTVESAHRMVAR